MRNDILLKFTKMYEGANMCQKTDSVLIKMIDDVIYHFILENRMFTASDVTCRIRKDNPNLLIYHNLVKEHIHQHYEDGEELLQAGYERTVIPIANPQPWLYYLPALHDPNTYAPNFSSSPTPVPTQVINNGKCYTFLDRKNSFLK